MRTKFLIILVLLVQSQVSLAQERGVPIQMRNGQTLFSYEGSYALLIGNSDYSVGWEDLNGVKTDLPEIRRVLEGQGFIVIEKQNLTGEGIRTALSDFQLAYEKKASRMLVWFAGHGHSLKLSYGDADNYMGYIVGTDAPNPSQNEALFKIRSVPMDQVDTFLRQTDKPRHILFVFDSCFSGSIFDVRAGDGEPPLIQDATSGVVRQIITSGSRDQKVLDRSIFRKYFVWGLQDGKADLNEDGYVTGTELGMYLKTKVTNESGRKQTPQYGTVQNADLSRGDFVFKLKTTVATLPLPPPASKEDGIAAIEAQATAESSAENRRQWQDYQSRMTRAYARMESVDAGSGKATTKVDGWGIFLRDYASDNPYSSEDERLRGNALGRRDYWATYKSSPVMTNITLPGVIKAGELETYSVTWQGDG
ncbi:MAG TPA: caspase family protein, partial [Rhodothermales bacterium]|nr:caspase family protein [Rhodothermales bacterium]